MKCLINRDALSRTLGFEHYKTGTGELRFIHITAKILSGRNIEQKADLSQKILAEFEALILNKGLSKVAVTVDIRDLQREAYSKAIF